MSTWRPLLADATAAAAVDVIHAIARELRALYRAPPSSTTGGTPLHPSLSQGAAGLALFFAYLSRGFPGQGYEEDAEALLDRSVEALAAEPLLPDLYGGFVGIAWVVAHLQNVGFAPAEGLDLDEIDEVLAELVSESPWQGDYDLITGLAGYAVYALERWPAPRAVEVAASVVRRLEELAEPACGGVTWHTPPRFLTPRSREKYPNGWYNLGVAHGVPGVVGVLSRLVAAGEPTARETLSGAVRWLSAQRLAEGSRSAFGAFFYDEPPVPTRAAWCYGDPGIGTALLLAGNMAGEPEWTALGRELIAGTRERDAEDAHVQDASLCHGAAGLGHLFNRAGQAMRDERVLDAARRWFGVTLAMRQPGEGVAGYRYRSHLTGTPTWVPNAGVLEGAAGIGLALLAAVTGEEPLWDRVFLTDVPPDGALPADAARGEG